MDFFSKLYGSFAQPLQGTAASDSGSSGGLSGFLGGLSDLANKGINAYKNFTAPTATETAQAEAQATTASYLPWILGGVGVLIVIVILTLVFRRK